MTQYATTIAQAQPELDLHPKPDPPANVGDFSYETIMEAFGRYVAKARPLLDTPQTVANLMRPVLVGKKQEEFHVLLLDTKLRLIRDQLVSIGLVDRAMVTAREVFRPAIEHACTKMLLVHGHPSGDPTPSAKDINCTHDLVEASKIVGIEVMDHVIIGARSRERIRDYVSFREENLM